MPGRRHKRKDAVKGETKGTDVRKPGFSSNTSKYKDLKLGDDFSSPTVSVCFI